MNAVACDAVNCFHCGEPVPRGGRHSALIDEVAQPMCCAGCAAVARTIADNGLSAYYAARSTLPQARSAVTGVSSELALYDIAEVQKPFVRTIPGGRQATLLVEGITCGACAWLIERRLQRCKGVRNVAVNVAARRVQVEWDEAGVLLSEILQAIEALGYRAQGFDTQASQSAVARERRGMLWRLFVAGFAMMQVMMYAIPGYIAGGDMTHDASQLMRWASFVLTIPVILWSAAPFFSNAGRQLRARRAGMDVPVALGIAVAFTASAWATVVGSGEVYFDSITMFVFLLLGARFLESMARAKSLEAQQRLVSRLPAVTERIIPGAVSGATERVAVVQLEPGDWVQVAPGGIIPADGKVVGGRSDADESLLTGESRPVTKAEGDVVVGGSINVTSPLIVEVTRIGPESVLAGIVRLMDRAQAAKPRIVQLTDRVGAWFVVALLVVAFATAAGWYWIEPQRALWVMVAVLVVSCPCALSLATPAALTCATSALYRSGILITRGEALEALAAATHFVFDKTGTLTLGRLSVVGVIPLGSHPRERCLALAAALEGGSEHPIAVALRTAAIGLTPVCVNGVRNQPGCGIEGLVDGARVRIGSPAFVGELVQGPWPREFSYATDDVTMVALADEHGYLALFTLSDALRPGARGLVRELQALGRTVCVLSGDRNATVKHVARELGVAIAVGEAGPAAKLAFVRELQARGARVAMVGDGVNDAPVLAQAQVSIAMGGGTDLAQANADMVLLATDLQRIAVAYATARATLRIIRQNLGWAMAYNALAIPIAVAGLITPLLAGIGMAVSSLVVVANALRLQSPRARRAIPPSLHQSGMFAAH